MALSTQTEQQTAALMEKSATTKARTIEVSLSDEDYNHMGKVAKANPQQVLVALGRFTAYANHADFDHCFIYRAGDSLEAYFTTTDKSRRLVMGAVWSQQDQKFGYHT